MDVVKDERLRAMAGSRSLSEVWVESCLPGRCADQRRFLYSVQGPFGRPAGSVGSGTLPSEMVHPLHGVGGTLSVRRVCVLCCPHGRGHTLSLTKRSSTFKKRDKMIRSVSLTAKKMLDMKQIFVVLTNPVSSALFSVFYTLRRTVFGGLKS